MYWVIKTSIITIKYITIIKYNPDTSFTAIYLSIANLSVVIDQEKYKNLHIIERTGKLGLGTAYVTGFKWALERDYEFVFEMDCDFSHDPKDVKNLLEAAQTNDLVIGSRYVDGIRIINWPFRRLLLSYCASIYTRIITGINLLDVTGGFKCFRREALEALDLDRIFKLFEPI